MIWDLIQQIQIATTESKVDSAALAAEDASRNTRLLQDRVKRLEDRVDRISLATMAIAEILRDRLGVTQEEIESRVREIDQRDRKQDGRLLISPDECPKCHHTNAAHRKTCFYCGEEMELKSGLFKHETGMGECDSTPRR